MAQFNSYPQKATPIAADTVLIYDSAGAVLKQVPIKNLFENYAGTSLGGSAQTVKSAIDALNSKTNNPGIINNIPYEAAGSNANSYLYSGIYYFGTGANIPESYGHLIVLKATPTNDKTQIYVSLSTNNIYKRRGVGSGSSATWGEWTKLPTRAEIDDLKNRVAALEN